MRNFALTGVGGFVAPRHLKAIRDTGNRLIAAVDPHDAVGVLDRYSFDVRFFTEFERFDRHLEKLRRGPEGNRVHFVSICSPNYLHDAHIRLALRVGADAICEKPLVINPWNLDALQELEQETGRRVHTVLQLRLHPQLIALRETLRAQPAARLYDVCLTYVTARGRWYDVSWKGSDERSGGIVTNIGIHLFDLLLWLFGPVTACEVHLREDRRTRRLPGARARARALVPVDRPARSAVHRRSPASRRRFDRSPSTATRSSSAKASPICTRACTKRSSRAAGFGIDDSRPAIELSHRIRQTPAAVRAGAPAPDAERRALSRSWLATSPTSPAMSTRVVRSARARRSGISRT